MLIRWQAQRLRQRPDRFTVWGAANAAFKLADGPRTRQRPLRKLLLGKSPCNTKRPELYTKRMRRHGLWHPIVFVLGYPANMAAIA